MVKKIIKEKTLKRKKSLKRKKIGGASPASSEELDQITRPTSEIGDSQRPVESSIMVLIYLHLLMREIEI